MRSEKILLFVSLCVDDIHDIDIEQHFIFSPPLNCMNENFSFNFSLVQQKLMLEKILSESVA